MKSFFQNIWKIFQNRLVVLYIVIVMMFSVITVKLFDLQIVKGDFYNKQVATTTLQKVVVSAPRGAIYDRYGVPLAINKSSFTVNIDASITVENQNDVFVRLINLLERNGEDIVDDFPISKTKPFVFEFDGSQNQEKRWKKDMGLEENLTAEECFNKLRKDFSVDEKWSDEDARKILSLQCQLHLKRYSKYIPVVVAYDVKNETIAAIEEEKRNYPGIYIDVEALRNYPAGKYFSHLLGYIRGITESELAEYNSNGDYSLNDLIGKDGIEKAFEKQLRGKNGKKYVEVDNFGRRIKNIDSESVEPVPGNKVFLTVDRKLQEAAYNIFEEALKKSILNRISENEYSYKEILSSMVDSNHIDVKKILSAEKDSEQERVKNYILSVDKGAVTDNDLAKQIVMDGIDKGDILGASLLLVMYEQGVISCDEVYYLKIKNGGISPLHVIMDKLNAGELTPHMLGMDPCTGSVVVEDIYTGDVLAAVSYPSYDNNKFVNNFDSAYYIKLQNDTTTPLLNRPFMEPRAPGSTFKMITATAGLEEGYIEPYTTIYDSGTFTKAKKPYARCWIGEGKGSHGDVNVAHALEVSCNYFFYEISYRMGNASDGSTYKGIKTLNKYMELYGLDDLTGVEIYELYNSTKNYPSNISSPEYREYIYKMRDSEADESELKWYDGDTIRTAIGQSLNNYTAATLTKYISTLANGGKRYSMHFLDRISSYNDEVIEEYVPKVEVDINIKPENLKIIHEGMYLVTSGEKGTLNSLFKDFPVKVAAKSGTAQQSSYRKEHTVFVGFAPYDNPQIAITVLIPFGEDSTKPAPNIAKGIISEYLGLNKQPEKENYNVLYK
ncbi:MAG: hypothetical protein HFE59_09305 [Clostridiales bacterium]|nr:hypothetical protein [Clostridiales bacterium]